MAQYKILTPEILATKGKVLNVHITQIEPYHIWSYVAAVEDDNVLWADPELARQTKYAGQIVPPGVLIEMGVEGDSPDNYWPFQDPLPNRVDGGGEWYFYKPVRVGDTITAIRKAVDFEEKEGRLGTMGFYTVEVEYLNQRNELVAKSRWTAIHYSQ